MCPLDKVLRDATHEIETLEHDLMVEYAVVEPIPHALGYDEHHHQEGQSVWVSCRHRYETKCVTAKASKCYMLELLGACCYTGAV